MKNITTFPPFYFFTFVILNFVFYFLFPECNRVPLPYNLTGIIAAVCGCYLLKKSSNSFEKKNTTFYLKEPSAFVQNDFYKISRNPMYLGGLIFIFGMAILTGNLIAFINPVLFFLFINRLVIPLEEIIMEKKFGDSYLKYKKEVRRWL